MKKSFFKTPLLKFSLGIVVGFFIAGFIVLPLLSQDSSSSIYMQLQKYQGILSTAVKDYFEDVDVVKLNEGAIRGMLQELDPHSAYITAEDMKRVGEDMTGTFEGIGIQFMMITDTVIVDGVIPDGPCEKVGMQARDRIVKVNGDDITGIPMDSVPKLLRGPRGTTVNLAVLRPGVKDLLDFSVTRDKISVNTINCYFIIPDTDIGYIQIDKYGPATHSELVAAGKELRSKGMKRLMLDLRGNPGGLLDIVGQVCDEFLDSDTIVYTNAKREAENQTIVATPAGTLQDVPLIVLIDGGSASASEITAGAIQDLDRGLVVGLTSFGKGLVQRHMNLADGSALRLTIAKFFTASGRCIQRPFKDKDNWKKLTDRLELEEGSNLEHALDKIKKEEAQKAKDVDEKDKNKKDKKADKNAINMDSIEVYYTRSGRPVLGGGGITPDYVVKYDTSKASDLFIKLRSKSVLLELKEKFVGETKDKYKDDFNRFNKEFVLTDKMFAALKQLAKEKDIEWNDEQYEADKDWIVNSNIKYFLANSIWGRNAARSVTITKDRQVAKAMELFPFAEQIQAKGKKK